MKMRTIVASGLAIVILQMHSAANAASPANLAETTDNAARQLDPDQVRLSVNYRYGNARPMNINGHDVLEHRYWSCIDTVTVQFPQPMRLATVLGSTFAAGQYNMKHALTLRSVDSTFRRFTWTTGGVDLCNDEARMERIMVSGVWTVAGGQLASDRQADLAYPASVDVLPTRDPGDEPDASVDQDQDQATTDAPPSTASLSDSESYTCQGGDPTRCFTVTPQRLNQALAALRQWTASEAADTSLYGDDRMKLMPLDFLMAPYAAANRTRQYGAPDTLYALRRAARFTQLLFPDQLEIPIADLSEADGSTPHSGDLALHPDGAHKDGKDVDWAYITTGSGNEPNAPYHWERNFWFLYALAESTGVDLALTSYKDTFMAMAKDAYNRGLINAHVVGRFNALLMPDFGMNHDKHMHVQVDNLQNDGTSRKFTSSDDVYNCYLAMTTTSQGGEYNYCVEPQRQP